MPLQLPPDILDYIFLLLRLSADFTSLDACSRASELFSLLTERHIYHHLTVTNTTDCKLLQSPYAGVDPWDVAETLSNNAHIRGYVQSLKILIPGDPPRHLSNFNPKPLGTYGVTKFLPLLNNVKTVVLCHSGYGRIDWRRLDSNFGAAFIWMVARAPVRELIIRNIEEFPLQYLDGAVSLKKLELTGLFCFGALGPTAPHSRVFLQSLTIDPSGTSMENIIVWLNSLAGPDPSGLTHLKAMLSDEEHYKLLPYILCLCSSTLEILEIDAGRAVNLFYSERNENQPDAPQFLLDRPAILRNSTLPWHIFSSDLPPLELAPNPVPPPAASLSSDESNPNHNNDISMEPLSITAPGPFSLSCLTALKHLKLMLMIEATDAMTVAYGAYGLPFEFVSRILDEMRAPPPSSRSFGWESAISCTETLEHMTLDIIFRIFPELFYGISWSPLASALVSFSCAAPFLKGVELRVGVVKGTDDRNLIVRDPSMIVCALESDVHLSPLVDAGLLKINVIEN